MLTVIQYIKDLYSISTCSWLLFTFMLILLNKKFIVKRYEEETDLLNTVFFKEHFTFAKGQPPFFASGLYTLHLLICIWGWRVFRKRKNFRDIKYPELITQHFSKMEIIRVKAVGFSIIIIFLHLFGREIIEWKYPTFFG